MVRAGRASVASAGLLAALVCVAAVPGEGKRAVVTDSWYKWTGRRGATGYFHMVNKRSGVESAPVLLIKEFVIRLGEKKLSLKLQTWCKDDRYLSPVRIVSEGKGDDEFGNFTATVDWRKTDDGATGTLKAKIGKRERTLKLSGGTVTAFALFDIVRRMPFEPGKPFEFHSLEASELNLKKDHKLSYVGEEKIRVGDQEMKAHKFEQKGRGIHPVQYWVSGKRELVRVMMDGSKEFLLTTEADAKKALK